ncbi:MAG TPA: hypothetical protein VJ698_02455 [Noviherbaspirillum sp.]|uniref:hypothetical protein n=1 Tax=Noviherbaspirillum sp. TaxID=1926288 RepID=UPI002B4926A3|nr:hypothetical protein [Noviherbaspirillum sp.]HJV84310.1 hypothetical protein [Noviherbaspirillum sp.]
MKDLDLKEYPYLLAPDSNNPTALAARRMRLEAFIHRTCLLPYKHMAGHRKIVETIDRSASLSHSSCWLTYGDAPILMTEDYYPPDLHDLGMAGVCWIVVDQAHSIYHQDTHMVLLTLPRYREQLIRVRDRLK